MGNKKLIIAIIVVVLLIAGIVGGYLYLQNGSKQAEILQEEAKKIAETDILKDEIDMQIKAGGQYGKVEETVKNYLNDVRNTYLEVKSYCNDEEISKILSAENIKQDSKELSVVNEKIDNLSQKLEDIKAKTEKIADENNILDAIKEKNLKSNYVDVYKNIMLNETIQAKLTQAKQEIEQEIEQAWKKIENLEQTVNFLKDNAKYWNLNGDKIQFTNVNKLAEYYELLNNNK